MAQTNNQIILGERLRLMREGILSGSGVYAETLDGERFELPEEIHTFSAWKARGFSVKKGEKAVAAFAIWKHIDLKKSDDDEKKKSGGYCRMKLSHFFKASQVEPLKARA